MPCFNAGRHLQACRESLARQTYSAFEVIAVDDGSSDETGHMLEAWAREDDRVCVFHNPRNLGLVATLNRGVGAVRGELVARMDADDEAEPDRFGKQVALLDARPELDVVSCAAVLIDEAGRVLGRRDVRATGPDGCSFVGLFAPPLLHAAAMGRRAVFEAFPYSTEPCAVHTEDYELWSRLIRAGKLLANQRDALIRVRISGSSVSRRHEDHQVRNFVSCVRTQLHAFLGEEIPPDVAAVVANRVDFSGDGAPLDAGLRLLRRLTGLASARVRESEGRAEIRDAAAIQRLDIVLQALAKGSPAQRRRAAFSLPTIAWAVTRRRPVRRYLSLKLQGLWRRSRLLT